MGIFECNYIEEDVDENEIIPFKFYASMEYNKVDCIVGFSFGTGNTNRALAHLTHLYLEKIHPETGRPLYMQHEIAAVLEGECKRKCAKIATCDGRRYLSTRGVIEQFIQPMLEAEHAIIGVLAHPDHYDRCANLLEELGFVVVPISPASLEKDLVSSDDGDKLRDSGRFDWTKYGCNMHGYDSSDSNNQFWTRRRDRFLVWNKLATVINKVFRPEITTTALPFYPRSTYDIDASRNAIMDIKFRRTGEMLNDDSIDQSGKSYPLGNPGTRRSTRLSAVESAKDEKTTVVELTEGYDDKYSKPIRPAAVKVSKIY